MHRQLEDGQIVYMIFSKKFPSKPEGVYCRSNHDDYVFESESEARRSNVHGIYEDRSKYDVRKFKVHLIEVD